MKRSLRLPTQTDDELAAKVRRDWSPWYVRGASACVEKSIANILRTGWLEANFVPAYFVAIVRDGYPVTEGIRRRAKPTGEVARIIGSEYSVDCCARQWQRSAQVLRQELKKRKNIMLVKYEDFVSRPDEILTEIWEWLQLAPHPVSFDPITHQLSIGSSVKKIVNYNEQSVGRLSVEDFATINPIIASEMEAFGYSLCNHPPKHK